MDLGLHVVVGSFLLQWHWWSSVDCLWTTSARWVANVVATSRTCASSPSFLNAIASCHLAMGDYFLLTLFRITS